MENKLLNLDESFDFIIHQLQRGNTVEEMKNNTFYSEFEKVKEWQSKYGYEFYIYSNNHPINKKPQFHLIKKSINLECRIFFNGEIHDYKGTRRLEKKTKEALDYFLERERNQEILKNTWNHKNPQHTI